MRKILIALFTVGALLASAPAKAGIPVIDVTAIAQLVQQLSYWEQQIEAMREQIDQLQQTYDSVTGNRGMENVLPMTERDRNYLPPSYEAILAAADGRSSGYPELTAQIQATLQANQILTTAQMDQLSPTDRQIVEQGRQAAAMVSSLSQTAYRNTSDRFALLQQLIDAIATTHDGKGIEELQARVNSEQSMLANDQAKLQSLYEIAQAQEANQRQRLREQTVAAHGSFLNRFSPHP
jgi:type IV secretion system protein VirB5